MIAEEEHSTGQSIVTMTRTRRKQRQEMVKKAVREAEEVCHSFCLLDSLFSASMN